MKIINAEPHLNFINNGFVYICPADDGSYWIRSVAGKWAKIDYIPMKFADLEADFNNFVAGGRTATLLEVKSDNTDQIVIEPIKILPNPDSLLVPVSIPITPNPTATSTPIII